MLQAAGLLLGPSQKWQNLLPSPVCHQVVARCKEDILKARGVKPTLSPNLNVLATIEALDVKRLLFIGVGCQVRTSCCGLHYLLFTQVSTPLVGLPAARP